MLVLDTIPTAHLPTPANLPNLNAKSAGGFTLPVVGWVVGREMVVFVERVRGKWKEKYSRREVWWKTKREERVRRTRILLRALKVEEGEEGSRKLKWSWLRGTTCDWSTTSLSLSLFFFYTSFSLFLFLVFYSIITLSSFRQAHVLFSLLGVVLSSFQNIL